jgi:chromosome segregation ATPase
MSDSRILTDAIGSLQSRIDELEKDNAAYRRESVLLRLKLNAATESQSGTEARLHFASDDTLQMLTSASEALKDLRQLKRENRLIVEEQSRIEAELGKVLKENADLKKKMNNLRLRIDKSQETRIVYDRLILDMLIPPVPQLGETKLRV